MIEFLPFCFALKKERQKPMIVLGGQKQGCFFFRLKEGLLSLFCLNFQLSLGQKQMTRRCENGERGASGRLVF